MNLASHNQVKTEGIATGSPTEFRYEASFVNYKEWLREKEIQFACVGNFLLVGEFPSRPEWLLYISVVKIQAKQVFDILTTYIIESKISVTLPENSEIHAQILNGSLGWGAVGKVFTLRVNAQPTLQEITETIAELTKDLAGPVVPLARKINGNVYSAYEVAPYLGLTDGKESEIETPWPFSAGNKPTNQKPSRWRSKKYFLTHLLKNDPKGNVYQALYFKKWFDVHWCVIKEGKKAQCFDDYDRSIKDRLKWQYHIQSTLGYLGILPEVIALFEEDENWYFAMEYIEGSPYNNVISEIQEGAIYKTLSDPKRSQLLDLINQLLELVATFHDHGFLHRDITPLNFLVNKDGKLVAIDVELSYDFNHQQPFPWFTLGTEGYMSPQQRRLQIPQITDDIYGLAGMIIRSITGISPIKFERLDSNEIFFKHLNFFINDQRLTNCLVLARDQDESQRPELKSIAHALDLHRAKALIRNPNLPNKGLDQQYELNNLIERSAEAVQNQFFQQPEDGVRSDQPVKEMGRILGELDSVYVLASGDNAGFDFAEARTVIANYLSLVTQYLSNEPVAKDYLANIKYGASQIAILLAEANHWGFIELSPVLLSAIYNCTKQAKYDFTIREGLTGQAFALLKVGNLTRFDGFLSELHTLAETIKNGQQKAGYWLSDREISTDKSRWFSGFMGGIAGTAYFLLLYGYLYEKEDAISTACRSLTFLIKKAKSSNHSFFIPIAECLSYPDPWFEKGFSGVAYTFIRAFELTGNNEYKDFATRLLNNHPPQLSSNYVSQANGIAGLGEVYLEAYRVFKEETWLERASFIGSFFLHTYSQGPDKAIYWLDGNETVPDHSFWAGNAGILHFLSRLAKPNKVNFPIYHI